MRLEDVFINNKIQKNNLLSENARDPEVLETFEALVSRFSRTTDIFLAKYLSTEFARRSDKALL